MYPYLWQNALIKQGEQLWQGGDGYAAGQVIFEHIPVSNRGLWAIQLIDLFTSSFMVEPHTFRELQSLACEMHLWPQTQEGYQKSHQLVITGFKNSFSHPMLSKALEQFLACGAKVIHNARYPNFPLFDHSAAWKFIAIARDISGSTEDKHFMEKVWRHIVNPIHLQQEIPVRCSHSCPFCMEMYGLEA